MAERTRSADAQPIEGINENELFSEDMGITNTQKINREALNDFLESDEDTGYTTGDADDVEPISDDENDMEDEDTPPPPPNKKNKPKSSADKASKVKKETEDRREALENFLEDDDDEDEDTPPPPPKKNPKKKDEEQQTLNEDEDETPEGTEDDDADLLEAFGTELFKQGILTPDYDSEGNEIEFEAPKTTEELKQAIFNEKKKGAYELLDDVLSKKGDKYKKAFEAIYVKGVDPEKYFSQQAKLEKFKDMDLKDADNQERVVKQALKNQGWEDEDIEAEVKRLKDYQDLEETSKRYHKGLVKTEEQLSVKMEEQAAKEEEESLRMETHYYNSLRDILGKALQAKDMEGIPITAKDANETLDFLFTKKWKLPDGQKLTDFDLQILELKKPENYKIKVKLGLLLRKGLDLTKVQTKAVSKESDDMFNEVLKKKKQSTRKKSGGSQNFSRTEF